MSAIIVLIIRVAIAGALYAFLAWALWVLWRYFRAMGDANLPIERIVLREMETGKTHIFVIPQVNLGRDPANDFCIEEQAISGRHARLSYHHRQWWVQDLGSRNGTFLNHEEITEPVALADGDELQFGPLSYEVELGQRQDDGANPVYNDGDL